MNIFKKIFSSSKEKGIDNFIQFGDGSDIGGESSRIDKSNLLNNNKNWVYVCSDKIANSTSSIKLCLKKYNSKGDDEEVFDHPLLTFIYNPSKVLTQRQWVYTHITNKLITGNAYWKIDKKAGKINLIPLVPTRVSPVVDELSGEVTGYKYRKTNGKTTLLSTDEVLHDKTPNPQNPYVGLSILEPIAEWVDIDAYASEFNRKFFINGAKFGGFIETEDTTESGLQLIQAGLQKYTGVKNSHKIGILPKGSKFNSSGQSMSDMQFIEADARYRDKILSAFGVPKAVVGIVDDVNRANAEASEYVFAKYSLKPVVVSFIDFLNEKVVPLMADSEQYYFDYKEFVPEDRNYELKKAEIALNKNPFMTINEVRAGQGLAPISNGDNVYGSPILEPVGKPEQKKYQKPLTKKEKKAIAVNKIAEAIYKRKKTANKDGFTKEEEDFLEAEHKKFVGRVSDYEKQLTEKVRDFNNRQKNDIRKNLKNIINKAVKKDDIMDYEKENELLIDIATPILTQLGIEEAQEVWANEGFDGDFDPNDERLKKAVDKSVNDMAKSYNDTTRDLVKQELNEGLVNGESLAELSARVETVYEFKDRVGAVTLARTEAFNIANESSLVAYKQSDVVKSIKWFTSEDERVCEYCGPMHAKEIGINDVYFKKGEVMTGSEGGELKLDYRTINHPPLHTNCRCFIKPEKIEV